MIRAQMKVLKKRDCGLLKASQGCSQLIRDLTWGLPCSTQQESFPVYQHCLYFVGLHLQDTSKTLDSGFGLGCLWQFRQEVRAALFIMQAF